MKTFIADLTLTQIDETNTKIECRSGIETLKALQENMSTVSWVMDFHIFNSTAFIQTIGNPSHTQIVTDVQEARFA